MATFIYPPTTTGGSGAVDSVNGQTGVVVLDADDVGAATQALDNLVSPMLNVSIDANNNSITNLVDPTNPQDVATKAYVDANAGGASVALDNLASVAINADLDFGPGHATGAVSAVTELDLVGGNSKIFIYDDEIDIEPKAGSDDGILQILAAHTWLYPGNADSNRLGFWATDGSFSAGIKAPATLAADYTLVLPADAGTSGYVLQTDGAGTLSWVASSGGGPGGLTGAVQFNTAGVFDGDETKFFWDNASKYLGIGTNAPRRPLETTSGEVLVVNGQTSGDGGIAIQPSALGVNLQGTNGALNAVKDVALQASGGLTRIGDTLRLSAITGGFLYSDGSGDVSAVVGANGSFTTVDLKTVTVVNGLITSIV